MKQVITTIIFAVLTVSGAWSRTPVIEYSDRYFLTFDSTNTDRIHVNAQIQLEDSLLYMSPYGPMPERWPQYIQNLHVSGPDGQPISMRKTKDGAWILSGIDLGMKVELTYDMVLEHEQIAWPGGIDGVAYTRDWGIMASGRSLFVMNGQVKKDIQVKVESPGVWNVSTSWQPDTLSKNTYRADNLFDLQESFLFVGSQEEVMIQRDGFALNFVLGGDRVRGEASRFVNVASGVMDYYIRLMGGIPKGGGPGKELNRSLVIISQSGHVDGEVIGNHLSMFMNPDGSPMDQMMGWFMFAHEFFHLWNGKTLRFADTTTDWFKEGISNYYTIKALKQTGFINEDVVLGMMNNLFYQRYIQDPGYGSLSPSRAASGFDKDNHWGLIYGGGLFAGMAIDLEIRHRTGNVSSLDDVMREFYTEFGCSGQTIDQTEILEEFNKIGNTDFAAFMKSHILGTEVLTLAPYFKYAGIKADTSANELLLTHLQNKTALQSDIWAGFLGDN
jgi:predicted metalloprotease with PDZ domain